MSAGHPPALLVRAGQVQRIGEDGDIPLGIVKEHRFSNSVCSLQTGDLLVVFTDGIHEAKDRQGQQLGLERIEAVLRDASPEPDAVLQALRSEVFAHQDAEVGHDDQTILVLRQVA